MSHVHRWDASEAKFAMNTAIPLKPVSRILVVDDHPLVVEGLVQFLGCEPDLHVQWRANSIATAMAICRAEKPDLAIVDITLADGSGLDLVRQMLACYPGLLVLVISMHDEALYADRALRAGARGYLMKHTAPKFIIDAIRKIQAGEIYLSESFAKKMMGRIIGGGDGTIAGGLEKLSDHELEIFRLIGSGLKKGEIAARLNRSVNTVEAHRANIKKKLNLSNSVALSRIAFLYTNQLE